MHGKIPVSVIIVTMDEERNLPRCLMALERFDEIVVVDSGSADATQEIARSFGARIENFTWNGRYPKKRQWCLDNLALKHGRVFFVDADEEVTCALCDEIAALDWRRAGYFVKGAYVVGGQALRFGLKNAKLCLFDRTKIEFPVVDDLDIPGMGEMEGHYQPVLKKNGEGGVGILKNHLLHHAAENKARYAARHEAYATWERGMRTRRAYPREENAGRRVLKEIFAGLPMKAEAAFLHSYILYGGFLDGGAGFSHAANRYRYYKSIARGDKARARRV